MLFKALVADENFVIRHRSTLKREVELRNLCRVLIEQNVEIPPSGILSAESLTGAGRALIRRPYVSDRERAHAKTCIFHNAHRLRQEVHKLRICSIPSHCAFLNCLVLLCRFRENLAKPCYFYLSHTCGPSRDTLSIINLALRG